MRRSEVEQLAEALPGQRWGRGPEMWPVHDAAPALRFAPACPGRLGFAVRPN